MLYTSSTSTLLAPEHSPFIASTCILHLKTRSFETSTSTSHFPASSLTNQTIYPKSKLLQELERSQHKHPRKFSPSTTTAIMPSISESTGSESQTPTSTFSASHSPLTPTSPSSHTPNNLSSTTINRKDTPIINPNLPYERIPLDAPHPRWHMLPHQTNQISHTIYEVPGSVDMDMDMDMDIDEEYDSVMGYGGSVGEVRESVEKPWESDGQMDHHAGLKKRDASMGEDIWLKELAGDAYPLGMGVGMGWGVWSGRVEWPESGERSSILREAKRGREDDGEMDGSGCKRMKRQRGGLLS